MTTQTASQPTISPTFHGRSRLAMARDLVVATICAIVVAGFLFDVAGGSKAPRPSRTATMAS